jgi:hypothetical protein
MIAGMALTNRMQASRILRDTSSFRTEDSEAIVLSNSRWFRPVDTRVGPDGAVYIADWFDIRLSHLSPRDNWDKANGRIYLLKAKDGKPIQPFDLSKLASANSSKHSRTQTNGSASRRSDSGGSA